KTNDLLTGRGWVMGIQTFKLYPELWNAKATPNYYTTFPSGSISTATWTYLAFTFKKNDVMRGYVNGQQVNSTNVNNNNIGTATMNLTIGAEPWNAPPTQWFANARIDEVRLSNLVRSAPWISTGYNNTYSPGTFHYPGSQLGWTC
ncbi:MAG TPA: LamG-like jellyroll fold domain-containing protein, partial [Methanomicrobiales archaeon]|nr:LamG-like jellyroll fold domain-containing protein [Methanomicrobiales archaeon]